MLYDENNILPSSINCAPLADLDLPRIAVIGNQSAGKSSLVEAISGISVPRDAGTSAVLNPGIDQSSFLDQSESDLKQMNNQLKFSRNAVCLDLSGPDLTDLAFVDLPGIIQNADPETVLLVEDLVTSNIKGNCLILVTLPMSDDIENQKAARLAKQEDPSGVRTIGVMTKPDTLPLGATKSRDLWLDVVEGRRFPLHHGYYCTRQPDDDERARGITAMQSRAAEKEFFAKTAPWSNSSHRHRFGIGNLVANLSKTADPNH
ncbi:hypothetical protein EW026_g1860 [Hermanssonia centrifuga]|uniref:Dynamin GTPase domain-containing protein n=1 Tax=Hermanssonia centrifuga TaxID=98765 RepID=A0A4S4KQ42_9APHY|nr:hypothetical protein EW026_g1860 [Hermanssonia centrifuga]